MPAAAIIKMSLIIGKGNLAGKGVYANKDFKKGEIVIKYNLTPLTQEEFNNLSAQEKQLTHTHNNQIVLYGIPERFVNHSDNPNTTQDFVQLADVANKPIKKGEQITTDHNKDDY